VRYARHNLDGREIRDHLRGGKTVVRLGLTWNDRISFVLTEHLQFKRLTFLDILERESDGEVEDEAEQFEIDFALMSGELSKMLADMVKALGGSKETLPAGSGDERCARITYHRLCITHLTSVPYHSSPITYLAVERKAHAHPQPVHRRERPVALP
jgi:hypothetical protein